MNSERLHNYKKVGPLGWSAVIFALSFNFGIALNSIGFALFTGVAFLVSISDAVNKKGPGFREPLVLLPVLLFLIISIRELVADPSASIQVMYSYSALLLIPVAVYFQSQRLRRNRNMILLAFLAGCLISATINLFFAFYRGLFVNPKGINFWYFTYDFLAEPVGIQPIYLALFYLLGILILLELNPFKEKRVWFAISIFILLISILLLSARNALVSTIILVPIHQLLRRKLSLKNAIIGLLLLLVTGFIAFQNPVIKNRIMKVNRSGNVYSGTSLRMQIWDSAWQIAASDIIWGKGEAQVEEEFIEEFTKRNMDVPLKYQYHAHNEYLQLLAQYGLVGLLAFVSILLVYVFHTFYFKEYLGFLWICAFSLSAVTESVLSRQWGLFAFVFFSGVLLLGVSTNNKGTAQIIGPEE